MKLRNVVVGQTVKVKKSNFAFEPQFVGENGVVMKVEPVGFLGDYSVKVCFGKLDMDDWGNHKDLKLIKDVD